MIREGEKYSASAWLPGWIHISQPYKCIFCWNTENQMTISWLFFSGEKSLGPLWKHNVYISFLSSIFLHIAIYACKFYVFHNVHVLFKYIAFIGRKILQIKHITASKYVICEYLYYISETCTYAWISKHLSHFLHFFLVIQFRRFSNFPSPHPHAPTSSHWVLLCYHNSVVIQQQSSVY